MGEWLDLPMRWSLLMTKVRKLKREKVTNRGYRYFLSKKTCFEMIICP
ncbi:MAG UNVERIFIED_CONTAM: hypothetical protein LVR29_33150 [Microcystis novacekii LVE1205-3]|jgi:hypothetical protein